ncbi:MAG: glycosyltransferase [Bacteroidetes bacterium]|nr:MAG: glycosyltransferase [Bacteroidota bacterium]
MNSYQIITLFFFLFIFELVYAFFLYPWILCILSKLFSKPVRKNLNFYPEITVIIASYNEENYIEDAVNSIYESGYPAELINTLIGSDGSTDNTSNVVKQLINKYPKIRLFEYPRSGKNYLLNQLVPNAETEIIFYMDADLRISYGTFNKLLSILADDDVGSVMASLKIVRYDDNTGYLGESSYQYLETFIRRWESSIYSCTNSLGTLYCIKKEHYNALPNNLVCDDLYRILYVSFKGKRVIFDNDSEVIEVRQKSLKGELRRRFRLTAGSLSTIWKLKRLLLPDYGWISFFVISHKIARYASPFMLIGIFISSLILSAYSDLYLIFVYGQLILYFSALIGWLFEKINIKFLPFRISLLFITMNVSFIIGILWFLIGGQNAKWERDDVHKNI